MQDKPLASNVDNDTDTVLILTAGGTIDKVYFDAKSDYEVGESVLNELLNQSHVKQAFVVKAMMRKDSLEMNDEDRQILSSAVSAAEQDKIIITHGTDTMTDTAAVLIAAQEKNAVATKTIVLTGALAPARFAQSDATFNVGMAFAAVQSLAAGVYIVMNGQIFNGNAVLKDRANNQFVTVTYAVSDAVNKH